MTNKEAIGLLESGSKMPGIEHNSEMLDEACRLACRALRKEPHICTAIGVRTGQVFFWRGYTLMVDESGVVCKHTMSDTWIGLEGAMVCELINNADEIMRTMSKKGPR